MPAKTLKETIAYAKERSGPLNYQAPLKRWDTIIRDNQVKID